MGPKPNNAMFAIMLFVTYKGVVDEISCVKLAFKRSGYKLYKNPVIPAVHPMLQLISQPPQALTLVQTPEVLIPAPELYCTLVFVHKVSAGFPSPATDYVEEGLDLNKYLIQHQAASFLFNVQGDSMRDAGIVSGDKVVVDRSIEPQHRHIVIAVVDTEYTIKRLYRHNGRIELRPENPEYAPIVMRTGSQLEIWGVVVGVVRRYLR